MAQKVIVSMTDDLDGKTEDGVETVRFVWRGAPREIDLSEKHRAEFDKDMARYMEHSRPDSGPGRNANGSVNGRKRTPASRQRSGDIRAWAKKRGYQVSERGRIPAAIQQEYDAAH